MATTARTCPARGFKFIAAPGEIYCSQICERSIAMAQQHKGLRRMPISQRAPDGTK